LKFAVANYLESKLISKLISKKTKDQLYIYYVRLVLTYTCAKWANTKSDEEKLKKFVRKKLRKIYGPIYNTEEQRWKICSNNQIN